LQIADQIKNRRTDVNLDIDYAFGKEDRALIDEAVELVMRAVEELKKMDNKKELLRSLHIV
jgi:DNA transposition AAA+ family ATPase